VNLRARQLAGMGFLLSLASSARAAESRVGLELRACDELSEIALREHLELELATLALSRSDARLVLRCERTLVVIELYRASGAGYAVEARVDLRDTAKAARERLVALSASELIAQAERARANPSPGSAPRPVERELTLAPPAAHRAPPVKRPRIELFVAGNAAWQGHPQTVFWGGSLGTRWGVTHTWSVVLDMRFERGQESLPLAEVSWTSLSGFVGAVANAKVGPMQLSGGVGARAGWLALAASAHRPNEGLGFTAPWAGVAAPLRIALAVGGYVSPFVGLELGYVALPVHGQVDDATGSAGARTALVEQRGAWISGSVGLALAL
jgi:hypothetical protein